MSQRLADRERDPQEKAADPTLSAFVMANAGSGKTKTLIDRVARLLIAKVKPETILCVTYTKAAAAEMQRRLFQKLGQWCVASDEDLRNALGELQARTPAGFDARDLSEARGLFAAALETPGGLKIQTIHAFCEKVLRRFPLEAGVSPSFRVMDDHAAAAVAAAARRLVAHHVLDVGGPVADAYARLSVALDFQAFQAAFADFEARRAALTAFFEAEGGLEGARAWVWRALDVARGSDPDALAAEGMARADLSLYRRAAETLRAGGSFLKEAGRLAEVAATEAPSLEDALELFFTAKGDPATWISRAASLKADPALQALLLAEQERLDRARGRIRAARIAWDSEDALTLAHAYLAAYRIEKASMGGLDFADLIEKTKDLLTAPGRAAWVLFKLDGGVEHVLVDEAQDTAPDQWEIVDALTAEFFAGLGQRQERRLERAMFVVGDQKQSIYSFQGAQPELLLRKFEEHRDRATGAGHRFERVDLVASWRSTPQVLAFVDSVFAPPELAAAIQPRDDGMAEPVRHDTAAPRRAHEGCVDVWDLEVEHKDDDREAWDAPLDLESEDSANRRLARRIAAEIQRLIRDGDAVFDKDTGVWRPARAGDVLILVRRRKALFEEILRALKRAGVPVAGADRLALSTHIVFDDLLALARFALFPDDELTLAALLKSPFCGLDDDGLYDLAHGRGDERLWARLRRRAGERPDWSEATAFLQRAADAASRARPFEFFSGLIAATGSDGRSMRQRLLTRLGAEAEDALDEVLNQVLAAEARGAHDLETLAAELAALDIQVKREMEADRGEVQVMTVHGAKGLERPIVFLPETTLAQGQRGPPLLRHRHDGSDGFLWCRSSVQDCPATAAARKARADREEAEAFRLLYVALTRARDRLVLCGRRPARVDPDTLRGWWGAVRDTLDQMRIAGQVRELEDAGGRFRRVGPDPRRLGGAEAPPAQPDTLPAWARVVPAPEAFARYASPSDLGEGVLATASPLSASQGLGRFRRGDLIHRLLQLLPDLPAEARAAGAAGLLAREPDLSAGQQAEMAAAALGVLEDPRFAEVFGPGSRPEVAVAGGAAALPPGLRISGRIDRLVVLPGRVLAADFKTNRPAPARIEDADPAYLRQMALYAAVLGEVFPGRRIEAALVWTDGPKLMPIPEILLSRALSELRHGG